MLRKKKDKFTEIIRGYLKEPKASLVVNGCAGNGFSCKALEFAILFQNGEIFVREEAKGETVISAEEVTKISELYAFLSRTCDSIDSEIRGLGMGLTQRLVVDPTSGAIYFSRIPGGFALITGTGEQVRVPEADHDHCLMAEEIAKFIVNPLGY